MQNLTNHLAGQSPARRDRSPSPAALRRAALLESVTHPKSYTVEAICAIPHPVPTHALAASACLTHMLTGSHDGYVRDYDLFAAVNGKNFLTAQQRHHCGVIEGTMKAVPVRCWWENPARPTPPGMPQPDSHLAPIYSMAMQLDGLWTLTGAEVSTL
jgi:transcriptional activator SPT8